ncbi:unnamed protein product [Spirodela intermedia]|uniref:Uncharacterized protein n=1 Tax=Spirodela intermedia TaxID=51605 RepID=A0A7I8KG53_SPIIN|nr:unnamed protein product [Spirodela intermedia]
MRMVVFHDSHELWQAIVAVHEETITVLDAKKTIKESWEILRSQNLGVDKVIQSIIQSLKHEYEILTM